MSSILQTPKPKDRAVRKYIKKYLKISKCTCKYRLVFDSFYAINSYEYEYADNHGYENLKCTRVLILEIVLEYYDIILEYMNLKKSTLTVRQNNEVNM